MNRFRKAWLALTDALEPEIREVVTEVEKPVETTVYLYGSLEEVSLYVVKRRTGEMRSRSTPGYRYTETHVEPVYETLYYATCEQAHSENPGEYVATAKVWRIGKDYVRSNKVEPIKLQPKPKVAKGRK